MKTCTVGWLRGPFGSASTSRGVIRLIRIQSSTLGRASPAACASAEAARLAREHNDANVLCLGRRILSLKTCIELLDVFLNTPFSGGERHKRRVAKMG
jgi:ribose 5-phosphate isomerase B